MPEQYMLCPKCGFHRYFVKNSEGKQIYFHVGFDKKPFPTKQSNADLTGLDFSEIFCTACSWSGKPERLIKYL